MNEKFVFDDPFYPVPSEAMDADPEAFIRDLIYRVTTSERDLKAQQEQSTADLKELLLELVSLTDDIKEIMERHGVTSNAREAAIIRSVRSVGQRMLSTLHRFSVEAINTVGQDFDPEKSDLVASEVRDKVPAGRVLREVETGYVWRNGILRRARVIISAEGGVPAPSNTSPADAADTQLRGQAEADNPSAPSGDDPADQGRSPSESGPERYERPEK